MAQSQAHAAAVLLPRSLGLRMLGLVLLAALLLSWALSALTLRYALTDFLPEPRTEAQRVLADQLGQGPGSRLLFIEFSAPGAARDLLLKRWQAVPPAGLRLLWPSPAPEASLPEALLARAPLLADHPQSEAAWTAILEARTADLASAPDDALFELVAEDPQLAALGALLRFSGAASAPRFEPNVSTQPSVLVLETIEPVFDTAAQRVIVSRLREQLKEAGATGATLYGPAAYGVDLQRSVQRESTLFTAVAGLALALLVLLRFRSLSRLLISAIPLGFGACCGLALIALAQPQVHGITLAFGFTLLGVAIDYPLHTLTHEQLGASDRRGLWQTLLLSAVSTLCAYGAFLLAGTEGIAQLGLFALGGITGAVLATAVLDLARPHRVPRGAAASEARVTLTHGLWLTVVALSAPWAIAGGNPFSTDLSRLTPVPASLIARDTALRQQFGSADLRQLIAVGADSQAQVLRATEAVAALLTEARQAGELEQFRVVTDLLPSPATQAQRRKALMSASDRAAFLAALDTSAFSRDAFAPYWDHRQRLAASADLLTLESFSSTPALRTALEAQLYQRGQRWVSLVHLVGPTNLTALDARLAVNGIDARLIDLKLAADRLVAQYQLRLLWALGAALIAIVLLLLLATRSARRTLWLVGTLCASLLLCIVLQQILGRPLSLFDLVALALVAGLGLDYGLFFSAQGGAATATRTRTVAVTLCAASSVLVFGILSLSTVPLLKGIGLTVTIGVIATYLLTRFGRYPAVAVSGSTVSGKENPST